MQDEEYEYVEKRRTKFLGLPLYFTKYSIGPEKINVRRGFLNITEDDAYTYKVQDVKLVCSFLERIFRLGTVICYTGDTTDPELVIKSIKHAKKVKEYLLRASEEARLQRRTRYNVNVSAPDDEDDSAED